MATLFLLLFSSLTGEDALTEIAAQDLLESGLLPQHRIPRAPVFDGERADRAVWLRSEGWSLSRVK
jgi:hypothetical protein